MKKTVVLVLVVLLIAMLFIGCAPGIAPEEYEALKNKNVELTKEKDDLQEQLNAAPTKDDVSTLQAKNKELETKASNLETDKKSLTSENKTLKEEVEKLNTKIEEAAPWFQKTEEEKQALIEEQKAAEEAEKLAAEEEAKLGYDSGITYDQLARTPDDYLGKMVKFSGVVLQVSEAGDNIAIRMSTKGKYDNVIMAIIPQKLLSARILEDDKITVYGLSSGIYTYTAVRGNEISIPSVVVEKLDV